MKAHNMRAFFYRSQRLRQWLAGIAVAMIPVMTLGMPLSAAVGQQDIDLPDLSEINCASYVVYDRNTGDIVISQNPDAKIYPASMTKIMTAILALEYLKTDQILTVSQTAIDATTPNSTLMGLKVGEQISVGELLYGLLLPSGNDAANVLAEAVVAVTGAMETPTPNPALATPTDGAAPAETTAMPAETTASTEAPTLLELFANVMNQKAAELGLINTHFTNANGLHNDNHYTTASELAKIFDCALGYEDFRTVISSPTHVFKATNLHDFDGWSIAKNTNLLLTDPWILGPETNVAEVVGGKTGTTITAGTGMTLLAVDKNGDELITVMCGIPYENANRLTSYMAAVLNAGADACYEKDPVVRVDGNVMDNKPENISIGFEAAVAAEITPTPTATTTPTVTSAPDESALQTVETSADSSITSKKASDSGLQGFVSAHPLIFVAVTIVIILILLLVITYFVANRKRKNRKMSKGSGIRRI